jgi:hypothetical protein
LALVGGGEQEQEAPGPRRARQWAGRASIRPQN